VGRAAQSGRREDSGLAPDEIVLLEALGARDEATFTRLVESWSGAMLRLARSHVDSAAVAEEVVQEAWLTVLRDLDRFEGRSSLRTWVLGIVVNLARSRARSERRALPFPSDLDAPAVATDRFSAAGDRWAGHWAAPPRAWRAAESEAIAAEERNALLRAIAGLPPAQREVLTLRDLVGCSAEETCNILGLTDTNQRVLLHRARSRVRGTLERTYDDEEPA
jgi:RNA polymerase sigma-70 factor (ECF subfamily)